MKISAQWLREWADPPLDNERLAEQLTMLGHEVDALAPAAAAAENVVVGEVKRVSAHPQADRLQLCEVAYGGDEAAQVVCGAPNVRRGGRYPYAPVGAVLSPPSGTGKSIKIARRKIRGIESAGMLCSAAELGLQIEGQGEDAGLLELQGDAPPGRPLAEHLSLHDQVFALSLTPNRGDCLSARGLARELAAANDLTLNAPAIKPVAPKSKAQRVVRLSSPAACPRYVGRVLEGVDAARASPLWMREKLRRSGVRSLGPVVDVTNYVMLELGQPMHAFDNDKLHGAVSARRAAAEEKLRLLDGHECAVPAGSLLIGDERGAVALAGVMGGERAAVSDSTRNLFLESAFFTPRAVAGRARGLGLRTEAAHRFERGVDPGLQRTALERATALLLAICGGRAGPVTEALSRDHLPPPVTIDLPFARLNGLLGKTMDKREVRALLARLGCKVRAIRGGLRARAPGARFDLRIAEDLVEEVARMHGYARFPAAPPRGGMTMRPPPRFAPPRDPRRALVERGFQEVITYSFVADDLQRRLFPEQAGLRLRNAISPEFAVMRLSLWPGLLQTLLHNRNRQCTRLRVFEAGRVFAPSAAGGADAAPQAPQRPPQEPRKLAALIYGAVHGPQWDNSDAGRRAEGDIFDLKADLEAVLGACCGGAAEARYEAAAAAALHPGQAAAVHVGGREVGTLGRLHPALQQELGLDGAVCLFELALDDLPLQTAPRYRKISKFPSMRRDLSLLIDAGIDIARIRDRIRKTAPGLLTDVELFDLYQGEAVAAGEKSVSLGLTFQRDSRTLTDAEVEGVMESVVKSLRDGFNARLRE